MLVTNYGIDLDQEEPCEDMGRKSGKAEQIKRDHVNFHSFRLGITPPLLISVPDSAMSVLIHQWQLITLPPLHISLMLVVLDPIVAQITHGQVDGKAHFRTHHDESHVPAQQADDEEQSSTSLFQQSVSRPTPSATKHQASKHKETGKKS